MIRAFQATEQQIEDAKTWDENSVDDNQEMDFATGADIVIMEGSGLVSDGVQKIPVSKGIHLLITPGTRVTITPEEKMVYRIVR